MTTQTKTAALSEPMLRLLRGDIHLHFDRLHGTFAQSAVWAQFRKAGTHLWIDSGDLEAIAEHWTREFDAVTVNNTLLSREIRKGTYDTLIPALARQIDAEGGPTGNEAVQMIAGLLNIHHGLRVVEKFDAHVSIEAHTALADDVEGTLTYARQAYAVCPERFYIKIPWTPAGLLATRQLSREGVPVNLTLGFSARQNYVAARLARPAFVNVFLGRLSSFVAKNDLGQGRYVGENTTLASQKTIAELRRQDRIATRQIAASFRNGLQVNDLVGVDVMTIPPEVTGEYLAMQVGLDQIVDRTDWEYVPEVKADVDPQSIRLETLWTVDQAVKDCLDKVMQEHLDGFSAEDLTDFFRTQGCSDVFVPWTPEERQTSRDEGKIPRLEHWAAALSGKRIGLDSLMNLAGLNSFATDQADMDEHIQRVLQDRRTDSLIPVQVDSDDSRATWHRARYKAGNGCCRAGVFPRAWPQAALLYIMIFLSVITSGTASIHRRPPMS